MTREILPAIVPDGDNTSPNVSLGTGGTKSKSISKYYTTAGESEIHQVVSLCTCHWMPMLYLNYIILHQWCSETGFANSVYHTPARHLR